MYIELRGGKHRRRICPVCKHRDAYENVREYSRTPRHFPVKNALRTRGSDCREIAYCRMVRMGQLFHHVDEMVVGSLPHNSKIGDAPEPGYRRMPRIISSGMLMAMLAPNSIEFLPEYVNGRWGNIRFPKEVYYFEPLFSMVTYPFQKIGLFDVYIEQIVTAAYSELDTLVSNYKQLTTSMLEEVRHLTVEVLAHIQPSFDYRYFDQFSYLMIIMQQFGGLEQFHKDYQAANDLVGWLSGDGRCNIHSLDWEPDEGHNGASQFLRSGFYRLDDTETTIAEYLREGKSTVDYRTKVSFLVRE